MLNYPSLPVVSIYISPADPSVNRANPQPLSSYAVNAQAFQGNPSMVAFRDGTSNTIGLAEHYSTNCGASGWELDFGYVLGIGPDDYDGVYTRRRRASFADGGDIVSNNGSCGDYYADLDNERPLTETFQVAPALSACDSHMPQTPHRSGMLIAMADGSCRILAPNVSPATFWALITPASGDDLGNDW
jgi:hypothetical protein